MKILILMRGVSNCGKSYRAKQILEEYAKMNIRGVIFSTDEYWYTQVFPNQPEVYSFDVPQISVAHAWNFRRAKMSMEAGLPLIIIDNTNITTWECKNYVQCGVQNGYEVKIEEPVSPWWLEISELLKDKEKNAELLKRWAEKLSKDNQHGVPPETIERMLGRFEQNLTVEAILR